MKNCKADMHKRPFLMNNSRRAKRKNYKEQGIPESDKACFVGGGCGLRVRRLLDPDSV